MMKPIGIAFMLCLFFSCNSDSANESGMDYQAQSTSYKETNLEKMEAADDQTSDTAITERKIMKSADTRFQVDDLKASTKNIEALTKQYGGFISGMNQSNSNYSINNSLSIQIPSEKLDLFLAAIEKESVYTNHTRIYAEDVTEEFVDISGRLATKKEVRDRYIDILRNKAKTVKDILEAEEKIRVIQEEIESIEGRLKYINNRTALSTVNIDMYQEVAYVAKPNRYQQPFLSKLKDGFFNGWELIQEITIGLISIWPIVLILVLLLLMRKRMWGLFRK